ncbi:hypothetical protein JCM6882_002175 [Rhodosporidiobolus microsporus]
MSTPTSPSRLNGTASTRLDKAALLHELAEQLKREKERAQEWGQKMVDAESQVEQKHREFLDEEAKLSAQRDANAATIAALRKELTKAKQALEEASHVDEQEAEAYLALLSNSIAGNGALSSPPARDPLPSSDQRGNHPSFVNGGIYSTSPINSSEALPSSGRPPRPPRPTSLVDHPYQSPSPYSAPPLHLTTEGHVPLEQSVWQDSFDEPRAEGVHPELAKNGGRWSKVFPGLKRRNSEVRRTDSFDEDHIVYPLSRPTSSASLHEAARYQPIPAFAAVTQTASPSPPSCFPRNLPSSVPSPPSAEHVSDAATTPSLPFPPPLSPLPTSLSGLFNPTAPAYPPSSPSPPAAMGFSFLRRSASATDLPVIPSETHSDSYLQSRQLYGTPAASASTNDLPNLFDPPAPSSPPPPAPPIVRTGAGGAIGPKAGARLLASKEAQRALRKADDLSEANDGEEFSIRERVPLRENRDLSTVTGSVPSEATEQPMVVAPAKQSSSSGSRTRSGSNSTGVRRVPVPAFEQDTFPSRREKGPRREESIHELTKRASQEEQQQDNEAVRRRQASLSKASSAGLASPFATPAKPERPALNIKKRRGPPVSGLNSTAVPEVDEHGRFPSTAVHAPRQRSASADSRASVTKEVVLAQLGEAIRREKKKAEMYERECKQSEVELGEIDRNLEVLKEKFATTLEQQEQVIGNLEAEIEEVKAELERVNDLDEATAQEYLALLSSPSIDTLKARNPVVTAFNPNALTSSASPPVTPNQPSDKGKFSALAFRRGLSLKRRVDTHIAAYDTVASNIAVPKPPLRRHSTSDPIAPAVVAELSQPRPRKLSKIRLGRAPTPSQEAPATTVPQPQPAPARPPPETPFPARSPTKNGRAPPPPPAPIFPASAPPPSIPPTATTTTESSRSKSAKKQRPPPVSGVSRGRLFGGLVGPASDSETEESGVKGRQEAGAPRKRSNSLTKTLRILFPTNAPKQQPTQPQQQGWLRSDRSTPAFDSR